MSQKNISYYNFDAKYIYNPYVGLPVEKLTLIRQSLGEHRYELTLKSFSDYCDKINAMVDNMEKLKNRIEVVEAANRKLSCELYQLQNKNDENTAE